MKTYTVEQVQELTYSDEYAEYIMNNSCGDRLICNGHQLLEAQEDGYMFEEFLMSLEK